MGLFGSFKKKKPQQAQQLFLEEIELKETLQKQEEQKERLKEHLRMENGRVPASKMMNEIGEIFRNVKEGKNS